MFTFTSDQIEFLNTAFEKDYSHDYYLYIETIPSTLAPNALNSSEPTYRLVRKAHSTNEVFPKFTNSICLDTASSIIQNEYRPLINARAPLIQSYNEKLQQEITEKCEKARLQLYYKELGISPPHQTMGRLTAVFVGILYLLLLAAAITTTIFLPMMGGLVVATLTWPFFTQMNVLEFITYPFKKKKFDKAVKDNQDLTDICKSDISQLIDGHLTEFNITPVVPTDSPSSITTPIVYNAVTVADTQEAKESLTPSNAFPVVVNPSVVSA